MHICGYIYIYMIKYASHWFVAGLKGQIGLCLMMLRKKSKPFNYQAEVESCWIHIFGTHKWLVIDYFSIFARDLSKNVKVATANLVIIYYNLLIFALPSRFRAGKSTIKGNFVQRHAWLAEGVRIQRSAFLAVKFDAWYPCCCRQDSGNDHHALQVNGKHWQPLVYICQHFRSGYPLVMENLRSTVDFTSYKTTCICMNDFPLPRLTTGWYSINEISHDRPLSMTN